MDFVEKTTDDGKSLRFLGAEIGQVRFAFTTRDGGVSEGPFSSLNLKQVEGEEPARVIENRRRVRAALDLAKRRLSAVNQVHGNVVVDAAEAAETKEGDGLFLDSPDAVAAIFVADCAPVLICAPQGPLTLLHAGWRGVAAGIVLEGVRRLRQAGPAPPRLRALIGPHIGPCCYEVRQDVISQLGRYPGVPKAKTAPVPLDLSSLIIHDLREAGLAASQIEKTSFCTACLGEHFFSYRRDGLTGRMAALAWLET